MHTVAKHLPDRYRTEAVLVQGLRRWLDGADRFLELAWDPLASARIRRR